MTNNGFENKKALAEQVNDIVKMNISKRDKVKALVKLGFRENEVQFILPVEVRAPRETFKYTFGVEIECLMNHSLFRTVADVPYHFESYNHTDNREYFKFTTDSSISRTTGREGDPIECVSPILDGNNTGFDKLNACCKCLNAANAYVNRSTGLHVHIGAQNISGKHYVNIFKNYQKLESVIDSFMAPSRRDGYYCSSIARYDYSACESVDDVMNVMHRDRYHKVNPMSFRAHGTVEFRQHQGTTNFKKIKMWVLFVSKLVAYSKENIIENVTTIDEIPFLNATEKAFFNARKAAFESGREREAA